MITVCFHGAESTGKSVLAEQLAREFSCPWVPEYGRSYCEERARRHGLADLSLDDLMAIAEGQDAANRAAFKDRPRLVLLDTDQLMTAAWAQMLFGSVPPALLAYPKADLYLAFDADVPWVDDGTRFFGDVSQRGRFATLAQDMLESTGVNWQPIGGDWNDRARQARSAIEAELANV